jgi:hypothetical protein
MICQLKFILAYHQEFERIILVLGQKIDA